MEQKNSNNNCRIIIVSIIAAFIVIVLWGVSWWWITSCIGEPEQQGQFGDMFGAVNALFSGLAFAGLIITLIFQQEELKLQRDELKEQREEMKRQRMEFEEQNETLRRQNFETTFFNMLTLHQSLTDGFVYINPDGADPFEAKGRQVFLKLYEEVKNFDALDTRGLKGLVGIGEHDAKEVFEKADYLKALNHYFHSFDSIVDFVNTTELVPENSKYGYLKMLTSTMTDHELAIVFYYYVASDGGWHKLMAEEYSLFSTFNIGMLAKKDHYDLFGVKAYNHVVIPNDKASA